MLAPSATHATTDWTNDSPLLACCADPQGRYAVSAAADNSLQRWDIATGQALKLLGHESWVHSLVTADGGNTVISGGCDGRLMWWSMADQQTVPSRQLAAHDGWIRNLAIRPQQQDIVATAGNDRTVKLWDVASGAALRTLSGFTSRVLSVAFHPSGEFVLAGELLGLIYQFEVTTGHLVRTIDAKTLFAKDEGFRAEYGGVRTLAFSADGSKLVAGGLHKNTNAFAGVNEPLVIAFDFASAAVANNFVTEGKKGVAATVRFISEDCVAAIGTGGDGGYLVFWKLGEDKPLHLLPLPSQARDLAIEADGIGLMVAHYDGHLRRFRMEPKSA